jgi:hypothetical protein
MSYESAERELEVMDEFIESTYDPDYGWIDVWNDEAAAIAYENREQELLDDLLTEEVRVWTSK